MGDGDEDLFLVGSMAFCDNLEVDGESKEHPGMDVCSEHGARFRRGDFNQDGRVDISDALRLLAQLFAGATRGTCLKAEDATDDGLVNVTDAIALLLHLFGDGPAVPEPSAGCGRDPTPDALECDAFTGCNE